MSASASVLLIEYDLGEAQRGLALDAWQERARQIAVLPGLRWKYWLRGADGDARGGVYLFETSEAAEHAAKILLRSLEEAGARAIRQRIFAVDPELSALTRGDL